MVNYKNGKIYKIVSDHTDKIYIGSTCQKLCVRMAGHRCNYKNYASDGKHYISSYDILKYDDAHIVLIEDYQCERKEQLQKREGEIVKDYKLKGGCVNKRIEGRTKKQYKKDNYELTSEIAKRSYNKHKLERQNCQKKYKESNKERLLKRDAEYRKNNKEEIKIRSQVYYEKVKEKRKTDIIKCDVCDLNMRRDSLNGHIKSKTHQKNLLN